MAEAREFGYPTLACDSTGYKGVLGGRLCAWAGLRAVVFCPHDTPSQGGADDLVLRGHYSEIGRLKRYDCGTDNPFRYEGRKTYAYEVAQGLGWQAPDRVVHPGAVAVERKLTIASAVSDDEIRRAMHDLAAEGLFVEPSGSIAVAGRPNHGSDESSLVIEVRFA